MYEQFKTLDGLVIFSLTFFFFSFYIGLHGISWPLVLNNPKLFLAGPNKNISHNHDSGSVVSSFHASEPLL